MPPVHVSPLPRIALIGVSGYGSIYLQLIRDALARGTMTLAAAVVINRDLVPETTRELKATGATIYGSAEELFAAQSGRIDLCLIPVGIQWHARLTIAALRAGMNVLVEKPLAGCTADSAAIRRAELDSGRWVAVGFQDLYSIEARWFKNQVLAGVIGRIEEVRMLGLWPRPRSYFTRNQWAGRISAEGAAVLDSPLNNAFAHFINLCLFFVGPSENESARATVESAQLFRAHDIEMFDSAVVRGSTDSGARFWFGVSHTTAETRQPEITLHGSEGRIEWWHEQRCVILDAEGRRQVFSLPSTDETRALMFQAVLTRIKDPATFVCSTSIAHEHTRFVEAVQAAARVQIIPSSLVEWMPDTSTGSSIPCVTGLAENLGCAFASGSALAFPPSLSPSVRQPDLAIPFPAASRLAATS